MKNRQLIFLVSLVPLLSLSVPVMAMNEEQEEPMAPFAMSQIDQSRDLSGSMHVRKNQLDEMQGQTQGRKQYSVEWLDESNQYNVADSMHVRKDQVDELQRRNEIEAGKSKARIEELRKRTAFLRDDLEDQEEELKNPVDMYGLEDQEEELKNPVDMYGLEDQVDKMQGRLKTHNQTANNSLDEWNKKNIEFREKLFREQEAMAEEALKEEEYEEAFNHFLGAAKLDLTNENTSLSYEKAADVAKRVSSLSNSHSNERIEWQNKASECYEKAAVAAQESSYGAQTNKDKVKWLKKSGNFYKQASHLANNSNEAIEWRKNASKLYEKAAGAAKKSFYEAQTNEDKLEWLEEARDLYKGAAVAANASSGMAETDEDRLEWLEKADAYRKKDPKLQKEMKRLELETKHKINQSLSNRGRNQ
jgi:hypothetical protein